MTEETTTTSENNTEQPAPPPEDIRWIDPALFQWRMENARLQTRESDDADWCDAAIYRLFPLSDPEGWLSVVGKENKEIGIIHDLRHCPHDPLALIRQELSRRYLVPQILRVVSCKDYFDQTTLNVQTDRGQITFQFRRQQENVLHPLPHRVTLIDIEGNRYDIPDINSLDLESRRMLEERI